MNAARLFLALVILLCANQCAAHRAHAAPPLKLPPHFYVYELVLKMGKERIPTGTAYKTAELCHDAAVEENRRTNSAVHFECEPLIVLEE